MATSKTINDPQLFTDIQDHANQLKSAQGSRNLKFKEYENMYALVDSDVPSADWVKKTLDPLPRTATMGAQRLLCATTPKWSVPRELNTPESSQAGTPIEKIAQAITWASSRVAKRPIWYEPVLHALLYSEVVIKAVMVKDLVDSASTPGQKARAERIYKTTPILFQTLNPANCYPEFDIMGMSAFYSSSLITWGDFKAMHGDEIANKLAENKKSYEKVTYNEYWNDTYHYIWLTEFSQEPVLAVEHGLPEIPIVDQLCEGSETFTGTTIQTRQPFLYTLNESGMWKRANLALTVANSLVFALGANPAFVFKSGNPNADFKVDFSVPGGVIKLLKDEEFSQLSKQVLDPAILQLLDVAGQKGEESTIFKQTLGEPLGANAPFSMVSLLSQSGRLPLIPYQRLISFALADIMKISLDMLRGTSGKMQATGEKGVVEFYAKEIPESFEFDCNLDIAMPTDERQNVVMATQATFGENPLVSMNFAREKWLGIDQPDEMAEEIMAEKEINLTLQSELMQKLQAGQQTPMGGIPAEGASQLRGAENTSTPSPGVTGLPMMNEVAAPGEANIQNPLPFSGQPPQGGNTPGMVGMGG